MKEFTFNTYNEILDHIGNTYSNEKYLSYIQNGSWKHLSVRDFFNSVKYIAIAFSHLGIKKGETVAIMSEPSPWWLIIDFALQQIGAISVPIFDNISTKNLAFEIKDANINHIYISNEFRLNHIKEFHFEHIFTKGFSLNNERFYEFYELVHLGKELELENEKIFLEVRAHVSEEDVFSIVYTSGNTDVPKGVELTHHNIVSQIKGAKAFFPLESNHDVALSFLPLAHIFERMVMSYYLASGVSVYFADDVKNIKQHLQEINPTTMTVVPRLLEKVFSKIKTKISETCGLKKHLAVYAVKRASTKNPEMGSNIIDAILDKLVYSKLRLAFGHKLKHLISGGAPLSNELYYFFLNIGLDIFQGYGMTEFSPVISANYPEHNKAGTCGKTFLGAEIKIADDGEILVRGDGVMRGYHGRPDLTTETIDAEGWLHTGDIGKIDEEGYLSVTSRKKELFKTSNGKYVRPIPIEQAVTKNILIDFCTVIAENKNFVTALIFPDFEVLQEYKMRHNLMHFTDKEVINSRRFKKDIKKHIKKVNEKLDKWEKIKQHKIITQQASIEGGELTPSMKVCRNAVNDKYAEFIEKMYTKRSKLWPKE